MVGLSFVSVLAAVQLAHAACLTPAGTIKPVVAPGYSYQVVANGLSRPRGLAFDSYGRLLVVQSGSGSITSHRITTVNGCIVAQKIADVVTNAGLNHAIQVSGGTLYSSTQDKAIAWTYNLTTGVASNSRTIVSGMAGTDHSTRPLQLSKAAPGTIIIGRGSLSNLDLQAASPNGGTAQVRAFDMTKRNYAYDWFEGRLLAWGVRNEVGLAEHPVTGGIYGVENSADQIVRGGKDVSNDNPGEELNYFGKLSDPVRAADYTSYYGYPYCLAAWGVEALPNNSGLTVGSHFGFDPSPNYLNNNSRTDAWCAAHTIKPRLTFQAHQAPLDIKFIDSAGTKAWVSFHGSWDRQVPIGYHVAEILFANGQPVEPYTSKKGENTVILGNADYTKCPNNCLRPVAMAVDKFGRVFVSSDATGEIYMITKTR